MRRPGSQWTSPPGYLQPRRTARVLLPDRDAHVGDLLAVRYVPCLPRRATELTRPHRLIEVADDVTGGQLTEELAEAQPVPHASPVGRPALTPATDGDLAFAPSQVFEEHGDGVEVPRAGDHQLGHSRALNPQRLGWFILIGHGDAFLNNVI